MPYACAILDDYQTVALSMADWSPVARDLDIKVFNAPFKDQAEAIAALEDVEIACLMRERTPFPRAVIEALPKLKLIITTGGRNASIDVAAANERGIVVCGTSTVGEPTAQIAFGLLINLARNISRENARLKAGERWQTTLGIDLAGKTLGVLGLGKLGARMAHFGRAFDMRVIAWSQNLTPERAQAGGAEHVSKEDLFRQSDFLSIHVVLSARSRGLVSAAELALMKPTAYLINTSRGPIVDEAALLEALRGMRIAGAGLDVFDTEPLPVDHPLRKLDNVVITPHLGYVTRENYRAYFADIVDDIRAFLAGQPVRVIAPR